MVSREMPILLPDAVNADWAEDEFTTRHMVPKHETISSSKIFEFISLDLYGNQIFFWLKFRHQLTENRTPCPKIRQYEYPTIGQSIKFTRYPMKYAPHHDIRRHKPICIDNHIRKNSWWRWECLFSGVLADFSWLRGRPIIRLNEYDGVAMSRSLSETDYDGFLRKDSYGNGAMGYSLWVMHYGTGLSAQISGSLESILWSLSLLWPVAITDDMGRVI